MANYKRQNSLFDYTILFVLFFMLSSFSIFISCGSKKEKEEDIRKKEIADSVKQARENAKAMKPTNRVGKYVYLDCLNVLHVKLRCSHINDGGSLDGTTIDEDGNEVDVSRSIKCGSGVKRILLKDMDKSLLKKSCHICIDDEMYEYLEKYGTLDGLMDECTERNDSNKKKLTGVIWN